MIRLRTRLLLCGAALAPASFFLLYLRFKDAERLSKETGWTFLPEVGPLIRLMLLLGVISLIAAIASFVVDLRRAK